MAKVLTLREGAALSLNSLAAAFGCVRETMKRKLEIGGVEPAGEHNGHPVYSLRDAINAWLASEEHQPDPDRLPPFERRAHYQAEIDKMKAEAEAGELIPRDEVVRDYGVAFSLVSQHLETLVDVLERDTGATPMQLKAIEQVVDRAREGLYQRLIGTDDVATRKRV